MKRSLAVLAALPLALAGCGSDDEPTAAAPPTQAEQSPAAAPVDTEALKAKAQSLLDRWGCRPLDEPLATNGAPGAFPGAPYVGAQCQVAAAIEGDLASTAGLQVFTSAQAKDEWVAYSTSQIGGTLCLGDDWVISDPSPLGQFVELTGCRVR